MCMLDTQLYIYIYIYALDRNLHPVVRIFIKMALFRSMDEWKSKSTIELEKHETVNPRHRPRHAPINRWNTVVSR